jgi:hyperosmotically inducible protein
MTKKTQILRKIATATIVLALGTTMAIAASGKPLSKEWLEGRVQGALAYNTYLDSSDLSVEMKEGTAILTGSVPSSIESELAEAIASNVEGVKKVRNDIIVDSTWVPKDRPVWSQNAIDATITAAVKSRLLTSKSMKDMQIEISTRQGIVTLAGTVGTSLQKDVAEQITFNTRDVRDVKNKITIDEKLTFAEKAQNAAVNIARDIDDAWISSKIRSSLFVGSDFPGSSVSVSTTKGKVTLEGYARNVTQRTAIENSVSDFVGVQEVKNNLTIRNS